MVGFCKFFMKKPKHIILAMMVFAFTGFIVSTYLTINHYADKLPECSIGGCQDVLTSSYSTIWSVPISAFGIMYSLSLLILLGMLLEKKIKFIAQSIVFITAMAAVIAITLIYIQIFVLEAVCMYCAIMDSSSIVLFILSIILYKQCKKHRYV